MESATHYKALETLLNALSPAERQRLLTIRKAYPGIPLSQLPEPLQRETLSILAGIYQSHGTDLPRAYRNGTGLNGRGHLPGSPAPLDYNSLTTILGTDVNTGRAVSITQLERQQGLYCIGATGTGKTTLLTHLILSAIAQGQGVCVIEPHNSLIRSVIGGIPEHRLKDVVLIDLADADSPVGINLFECPPPRTITSISATSSFISHVFAKVWGAQTETTPRLMMVLRALARTLIDNSPNATFAEIPLLLSDDTVREKMVKNLTNSSIADFWKGYNRRSQRDKDDLTASTLNKVLSFLDNEMIRNIVSQSHTSIDFRRIIDEEGKILLVLLSPQYEEASRLLGSVIIGKLLMSAFSRSDTPENKRRPFSLVVDEFQRYASDDLSVFLAEARKFRICTTLANQTLEQLDEANRAAAMQAGILICLRCSGEDSKVLAKSFDASPTLEQTGVEPIRAPVSDPIGHLLRRGHTNPKVVEFITLYLKHLEKLFKNVGTSNREFEFGCIIFQASSAVEGQRLLNDCLYECMLKKRSDLYIPPLALFTLGASADTAITYVYYRHFARSFLSGANFEGFKQSANRYGEGDFLQNKKEVNQLLTDYAQQKVWDSPFSSRIVTPGPTFIRMLTCLREAMEVLAAEPIMVDTGQYRPVYRQRTFLDMENEIANSISQMENYTARVKTLTGEHIIRTHPAPPLLPEEQIDKRIAYIKQLMREKACLRPASDVVREVQLRHERLRERVPTPPPPSSTSGSRRRRPRPTADKPWQ